MNFTPYLTFNGNCREAFENYKKIFGGKIEVMSRFRDEESCSSMPEEIQDKIMYARLKVGNSILMASDDPSGNYQATQSMHVSIGLKSKEDGARIFKHLSSDGEVVMPFSKSFFSEGFGIVRDKYGVPWMINVNNTDSQYY